MSVLITGILKGQRMLSEPHCRSLTIHTNELSDDQKGPLEIMHGQFVKVFISEDDVEQELQKAIKNTKVSNDLKSPSERLRSVLYVLYKNRDRTETFDSFYNRRMSGLIDLIKSKIDG